MPLGSSPSKTAFEVAGGELLPPEDGGRALQALLTINRSEAEHHPLASNTRAKKKVVSESIALSTRLFLKFLHGKTDKALPKDQQGSSGHKQGWAPRFAVKPIQGSIDVRTSDRSAHEIGDSPGKRDRPYDFDKTSDVFGGDKGTGGADSIGDSDLVLAEKDDPQPPHSVKPIRKYADSELVVLEFPSTEEWRRAHMVKLRAESIRDIPDDWPDSTSMVIPKWSKDLHVDAFKHANIETASYPIGDIDELTHEELLDLREQKRSSYG